MPSTILDPVPASQSSYALVELALSATVEALNDAADEYDTDRDTAFGNPDRYAPGAMEVLRAILHNDGPQAIALVRSRR